MIKDEKLGLKVAESQEEALIKETIESAEKSILRAELGLKLEKKTLEYLKSLAKSKE